MDSQKTCSAGVECPMYSKMWVFINCVTGAWGSMARYYLMAAGYSWGDYPDANDIV